MSRPVPPRAALADLARQGRALALQVRRSRWPGMDDLQDEPRAVAAAATGTAPAQRALHPRPAAPPPAFDSLELIAAAVRACTKCALHVNRANAVPGEGNPKARLMFVGEGPGAEEDVQGRPFVGRAGQLLTDMIEKGMGLTREEVFIANIVKCRPPGNRDPLPEEIAACRPYLAGQIALIAPEVICALGRHAAQSLLDTKEPIGRLRGRFRDHHGIPLMPTFHPSYLLRTPADKKEAWKDLQQILLKLGLPVPAPRRQERTP